MPKKASMRHSWVYMVTNRPNGTLYIGVTADLVRRVSEHRSGQTKGFTYRYNLKQLVWFETHESIEIAIQRETSLKRWKREWKVALIESANPEWRDLYPDLL